MLSLHSRFHSTGFGAILVVKWCEVRNKGVQWEQVRHRQGTVQGYIPTVAELP